MATKKNKDGNEKPTTRRAKLEAKLIDKLGQDVLDTILSSSAEELQFKLGSLAKYEVDTEESLEKDEGIAKLSDDLKQMKAPYTDIIKGIKLQRNVIASVMQELGRQTTLAGLKPKI